MTDEGRCNEYDRLSDAYDPAVRVADCPDPDATELTRVEVDFAIPVMMTRDQQRRLILLIDEITDAPWNAPVGGVHWLAGVGARPNWSHADAAMPGVEAGPDASATGEPTFDDSVFHVETCARAFVSEEERDRKMARRARPEAPDPGRDATLDALRAVAEFREKYPEASGDGATVTLPTCGFARVVSECRRALAIAEAARMMEG